MAGVMVSSYSNPPHYAMMRGNHRFIRGNHDNPAECRKHCHSGSRTVVSRKNDTMFIGGAVSIDRVWRQEGYNWWPDEELSITPLNILVDRYLDIRPRIMVTHDCPEEVAAELAALRLVTLNLIRNSHPGLDKRFNPCGRHTAPNSSDIWSLASQLRPNTTRYKIHLSRRIRVFRSPV